MRSVKLAIAIVLLLVATPLCMVDLDAKDATPEPEPIVPPEPPKPVDTTIFGYVGDVSNREKNIPLLGVTVTLLDENRQTLGTFVTDKDGYFEFTYKDEEGHYLNFDLEGYTVRTQPIELTRVEGEINLLSFNHNTLINNLEPNEEGKYQITSNVEGGSFVGMGITTATISGYVMNDQGKYLGDAKVILRTSEGQEISGYTNGEGFFAIECFFGNYELTVECRGFDTSEPMQVSTDNKTLEIVVQEKSHSIIFGMDTPHTWEFLSLIFMSLTVLVFLAVNHRVKKGKSEIVIINDLELEPEDEEKE